MAGGPYKGAGGWYHIKWSDGGSKKTEVLKTKKKSVADTRKHILETLERSGYHTPWETPWHENDKINHIVISGHLDLSSLANNLKSRRGETLGGMIQDYIIHKSTIRGRDGWSENMRQSATYTLQGFADHVGPHVHPDNVDDYDVQKYLYKSKINSDHTRTSYLSRIKACFAWGRQQGRTKNTITYQAEAPQADIPVFLTRHEILDICGYHLRKNHENIEIGFTKKDNTSLWMIYGWLLMASTGLRPGELMNLKCGDVEGGIIQVGKHHRTKTGSQRYIRQHRWAPQVIKIMLDKDVRARDRWMGSSDWLFGRHGNQAQRHLSDHFREARKKELPNKEVTLYNLRHSFATWYLTNETELSGNQDRRLYELMQILGHSKLSTTQIYLKAVPLATELE